MRTSILGLAIALASGPAALAQPAPPATPAPEAAVAGSPSVADQIDAFLKVAPVPDVTHEAAPGATSSAEPAERRIHGMVAVGVGTGGYRQAYGQADIPLGDTGQLSIAVDESRLKGRFGRWGASGQSLAFSGAFTGGLTGGLPSDCRARGPDGVLGGGLAVAPYEAPLDAPRLGDGCRRIERTGP